MKLNIVVLLIALVVFSSATEFSVNSADTKPQSAEQLKEYIFAFFKGLDLHSKIHPSKACIAASQDSLNFAAAGIDNYRAHNWYEGTLNISDSLGALSPLSRQCDKAFTKLAKLVSKYPKQFKSTADFFIKLGLNLLGNIKPLLDRTLFVKNEVTHSGNTTAVIQTIGEMLSIQFSINKVIKSPLMSDIADTILNYTWTDPLAPTPVNSLVWNIFESIYNLFVNSRFISDVNIVECEGAALNMVLYNMDAANNFNNDNAKEGLLSVFDSFTFLHKAVEGCTNTAIEIGRRSALIDEKVLANPSVIWKNFVHNFFYVVSDGFYGYAQHYFRDIISLMDAVADFFYRTITYKVDQ